MITLTPPLMVQKFQYQSCQQINDPVSGKRVYLTPGGTKTPSVTTILSATKDQTALDEWRKRVGIENAKKIAAEAANIGQNFWTCGWRRKALSVTPAPMRIPLS